MEEKINRKTQFFCSLISFAGHTENLIKELTSVAGKSRGDAVETTRNDSGRNVDRKVLHNIFPVY